MKKDQSEFRVALSAGALFMQDKKAEEIWAKEGQAAYDSYHQAAMDVPLEPGPAFHLIRKLLAHNTDSVKQVEAVILSRNSTAAGLRVLGSIAHYGLDISRAVFSQGGGRFRYLKPFKTDLFLSTHQKDVAEALGMGVAAACLMPQTKSQNGELSDIRIAFDGDAVLFSDEAEIVYKSEGLAAFTEHELGKSLQPMQPGPFSKVLQKLQKLRDDDTGGPEIRLALVTARGAATHGRVIRTLANWGVSLDEAAFLSGSDKGPFLEAFGADMFFDDQVRHIESASEYTVAGHAPYGIANKPILEIITNSKVA